MFVPIDDDVNAPKLGWASADRPARLRIVGTRTASTQPGGPKY
jgi:hypothetical protein